MSNVLINSETMSNIADAIRDKLSTDSTYLPEEMPDAIQSISGGQSIPEVEYDEYLIYELGNELRDGLWCSSKFDLHLFDMFKIVCTNSTYFISKYKLFDYFIQYWLCSSHAHPYALMKVTNANATLLQVNVMESDFKQVYGCILKDGYELCTDLIYDSSVDATQFTSPITDYHIFETISGTGSWDEYIGDSFKSVPQTQPLTTSSAMGILWWGGNKYSLFDSNGFTSASNAKRVYGSSYIKNPDKLMIEECDTLSLVPVAYAFTHDSDQDGKIPATNWKSFVCNDNYFTIDSNTLIANKDFYFMVVLETNNYSTDSGAGGIVTLRINDIDYFKITQLNKDVNYTLYYDHSRAIHIKAGDVIKVGKTNSPGYIDKGFRIYAIENIPDTPNHIHGVVQVSTIDETVLPLDIEQDRGTASYTDPTEYELYITKT